MDEFIELKSKDVLREGDECAFAYEDGWFETHCAGMTVEQASCYQGARYRRRVELAETQRSEP